MIHNGISNFESQIQFQGFSRPTIFAGLCDLLDDSASFSKCVKCRLSLLDPFVSRYLKWKGVVTFSLMKSIFLLLLYPSLNSEQNDILSPISSGAFFHCILSRSIQMKKGTFFSKMEVSSHLSRS